MALYFSYPSILRYNGHLRFKIFSKKKKNSKNHRKQGFEGSSLKKVNITVSTLNGLLPRRICRYTTTIMADNRGYWTLSEWTWKLGFMNEVRKSSVPRCVKVHESAFSFLIHPWHKHPWKIASLRTDELVFGDFLSRRWPSLRNETIDDDSSETLLLIVTVRNILVIGPNSFLRLSQQRDDRSREWEEFCHWEIFQGMGFLHDDSCELLRIIMGRIFSGILLNLFTILLYEKCIFTYIQWLWTGK